MLCRAPRGSGGDIDGGDLRGDLLLRGAAACQLIGINWQMDASFIVRWLK